MGECHERQGQCSVADRRTEDRHQYQRKQQAWQRQHDVDDTHDDVVDQAPEVACDQPENHAQNQREHHHQTTDQQRQTRTVHQTGQHIAAHIVGTQKMSKGATLLPGRRRQQHVAKLIRRVIGCKKVRKYRDDDHDGDIHQTDNRAFITFEVVPELLQRRHWHRCSDHFISRNL
ncbi:hypothetical protein D3C75_847650 [compost metagenome]